MVFASRLQIRLLLPLFPILAAMGQKAAGADQEVGSKTCNGCHPEIYRNYSATSMSQSSGKVGKGAFRESFYRARFSDPALGAQYSVSLTAEGYRLEFSRDSAGVRGERVLGWFIGSGRVGRSYVSSLEGFLFQAPVSYYTLSEKWGVSPGFEQHSSLYFTRAVSAKCLQCHASRLQPVAGAENRFSAPPFLEGGVSCERCHGPGKNHVDKITAGDRKGLSEIVNPAKLEPARRDSVCAQCHLTGAARVARARAARAAYRPGELLSEYTAYFVWTDAGPSAMSANSHFEKLQQSACKKASGDRLWCGSCHDPHSEPEAATRAEFYRARCRKCHEPSACKESLGTRRKAQDDCSACHMPKDQVRETEHAVFTDHSIPRRPRRSAGSPGTGRSLAPFWNTPVEERDLGLAFAMVAGEDSSFRRRAFELLQKAEARDPEDLPVLIQLAQLLDETGREDQAMALSERIVRLDPSQAAVAVNLGTYYIKRGRVQEAMRLWQDALSRNPGLTGARINLAVAQHRAGDAAAAEATLRKALQYDPDQETARKLLAEIRAGSR
ncbi:MAG: tetratricopeptide repeat protein [Acidobacteria bacterium]|nr:tetratricopeptide repeat protein [Acidobacteriota bacterium]